jgi:GNAT superfamily N-acetyltransferase
LILVAIPMGIAALQGEDHAGNTAREGDGMMEDGSVRDQHARSSSGSETLKLRPLATGDDVRIVEIYNQQERDSVPLTLARFRAEHAEKSADRQGEQWLALDKEQLVGSGSFHPAWWTGHPGIYVVEIRVDPSRWRQGIGTRLYDLLRSQLLTRKAIRLVSWVRADAANARRFAAHHGFRETGKVVQECRLYVPDAETDGSEELEERLRRGGVRIASLADLGRDDELFLRALQRVSADSREKPPDPAQLCSSFPSWRRAVLHAAGLTPETHWVALDGDRPVGMTFLKRLSEDAAENDYTGVASTHRRRGIAPALKLRAIAWARQHGVNWFYTSSEIGNARMLAINRRLGYRPGVRRLEVSRDLP